MVLTTAEAIHNSPTSLRDGGVAASGLLVSDTPQKGIRTFPLPEIMGDVGARAKSADVERRDELLRAFYSYVYRAVLASESQSKIDGLSQLLVALMGKRGEDMLTTAMMRDPEIASTSVLEVADQKARAAYRHHLENSGDPVDERIIAIVQQFEFSHIVDSGMFELVKQFMPKGIAFIGADVNFWTKQEEGVWQQQLKLERLGRELTDAEFLQYAEKMKAYYCHPASNEVQVLWDIGVVVLNGGLHEFHDQIEIIAEPIDEWLFWQFMLDARESGLLYAANPHFALIECLIAQDKIKSMATLSSEERRKGLSFAQKRFKPGKAELEVVMNSIRGNRPPRIPD